MTRKRSPARTICFAFLLMAASLVVVAPAASADAPVGGCVANCGDLVMPIEHWCGVKDGVLLCWMQPA